MIDLTPAAFGNVQLHDTASRVLSIAAQRGFRPEFLDHVAAVGDAQSACGRQRGPGCWSWSRTPAGALVGEDCLAAPSSAGDGWGAVCRVPRPAAGPPLLLMYCPSCVGQFEAADVVWRGR